MDAVEDYAQLEDDVFVEAARRRVGSTLRGKYRLDKLLGVGGMAAVYATTHRNGSRGALKLLHPHITTDPGIRSRFLREGYVANTVAHPGAVKVVDDDILEDGTAFLVMELLEGMSLDSIWERYQQRIPPEAALALGAQLLAVVQAAHEKDIIHRDIKPENLFVTREGILKLLDFGIARMRDANAANQATRTGTTIGTPAFMAPEQAMGDVKNVDARSDIYAVGAVLFTLLSGHYVHEGESAMALLVYAGSRPARSLATVAPQLHPAIIKLVDGALAFERGHRFPSARAMREELLAAFAGAFLRPLDDRALVLQLLSHCEPEANPGVSATMVVGATSTEAAPLTERVEDCRPSLGSLGETLDATRPLSPFFVAPPPPAPVAPTVTAPSLSKITPSPVSFPHAPAVTAPGKAKQSRGVGLVAGLGVTALVLVAAVGALIYRVTSADPAAQVDAAVSAVPSAEVSAVAAPVVAPTPVVTQSAAPEPSATQAAAVASTRTAEGSATTTRTRAGAQPPAATTSPKKQGGARANDDPFGSR